MELTRLAESIGKLIKEGKESVLIEAYQFNIKLKGGNFLTELLFETANRITYIKEQEGRDDWQKIEETLLKKTGDCEDFTIFIGAVLLRAGYPVLLKFVAGEKKDNFDHVYPITWNGENWVALDATLPQNIGLGNEPSFVNSLVYTIGGEYIGDTGQWTITWWLIPCIAIAAIVLILLRG